VIGLISVHICGDLVKCIAECALRKETDRLSSAARPHSSNSVPAPRSLEQCHPDVPARSLADFRLIGGAERWTETVLS
jgi:hypothetical protein